MNMSSNLNVVLVDENSEFAATVAFALSAKFGLTVLECESLEKAHELFGQLSHVDVLIAAGSTVKGKDLPVQIGESQKPLSLILYVEETVSDPTFLIDPRVLGIFHKEKFVAEVERVLEKTFFSGGVESNLPLEGFCQIKPNLLLGIDPLPIDIYIRLAEDKYLKIFQKKSQFGSDDYNKYVVSKGLDFFFVKRTESLALLDRFQSRIKRAVESEKPGSPLIRELSSNLQESLSNLISVLGVTEEVQQMAEMQISLVMNSVRANSNLQQIMDLIRKNEDQYIYDHSLLLAEVCCAFASMVGWTSDGTFQKLVTAAVFHDISLKNPQLARIRTRSELMSSQELIFAESQNEVLEHPLRAAELLTAIDETATDAVTIVTQHHERPDGDGFPRHGVNKTTPLACLFNMAEDFVQYYEKLQPEEQLGAIQAFLAESKQLYNVGPFRNIWRDLNESAKK
jgi:HD-GYP domain-containing protein (c-di-GMP phosphodiesterase class II)